jgi:hypothetical protein
VIVVCIVWHMSFNAVVRWRHRQFGFRPPRPMLRPTTGSGLNVSSAGMRRIVTLAEAMALPAASPYRDLIVLTAFSVVLGTLVIQGLTLKPLLRALNLHDPREYSLVGITLRLIPKTSSIFIVLRLKSTMVVVLVALWLPASSHALLQHFGFIHQAHVHDHHGDAHADHDADSEGSHEHDTDNHPAADGLCLSASGKVELAKPVTLAALPWLIAEFCTAVNIPSAIALRSGPSPPGVAPPELSHRWQFSSRAALPVRAPSFVS